MCFITLLLLSLSWLVAPEHSVAQARLYIDLQVGANHTFAEGAYFGKGSHPFKAYSRVSFAEQAVVMPRVQLTDKFSLSVGYSGSNLGWAYSLQVPRAYTHNPFEGEWLGAGAGLYMHQLPLLLRRRIGQYNMREIDTVRHVYLASFKLDLI
ncbi:hypothetical protein SAMN00120144_4220 [Hymenobacter roseosalivarius DSM 11622]|uniref:Uncharacterized protein n=1 Tax=Hymenobacter roseosalivarius DSM 11622 TaxID=645990 RepID=A0A1W1UG77_9BACT|nr:hypothetical protein [Hymenobacter roseosalivarius]SMB79784.1 hypothetical protein SAMN00120144_4220 [Hymenobacter roseosalivarius DSM 11622]